MTNERMLHLWGVFCTGGMTKVAFRGYLFEYETAECKVPIFSPAGRATLIHQLRVFLTMLAAIRTPAVFSARIEYLRPSAVPLYNMKQVLITDGGRGINPKTLLGVGEGKGVNTYRIHSRACKYLLALREWQIEFAARIRHGELRAATGNALFDPRLLGEIFAFVLTCTRAPPEAGS